MKNFKNLILTVFTFGFIFSSALLAETQEDVFVLGLKNQSEAVVQIAKSITKVDETKKNEFVTINKAYNDAFVEVYTLLTDEDKKDFTNCIVEEVSNPSEFTKQISAVSIKIGMDLNKYVSAKQELSLDNVRSEYEKHEFNKTCKDLLSDKEKVQGTYKIASSIINIVNKHTDAAHKEVAKNLQDKADAMIKWQTENAQVAADLTEEIAVTLTTNALNQAIEFMAKAETKEAEVVAKEEVAVAQK